MKKVNLSLLAIAVLLIAACSKKNDDNNASIVGVWKIQSSQTVSGVDSKTVLEDYSPEDDCKKQGTSEFTSDNKYINKSYVFINNNCIEDGSENTTYSYDEIRKKLTLWDKTSDVTELTDKSLVIKNNFEDFDNDGINDITTSRFTRAQ